MADATAADALAAAAADEAFRCRPRTPRARRTRSADEAFALAAQHAAACAQAAAAGAPAPAPPCARGSDAFWRHALLRAPAAGLAPALSPLANEPLSRTAREEAELRGLAPWDWRAAGGGDAAPPGAGVRLRGLQAAPQLNGRLGRALPPGAAASGRVAVRLAGAGGQTVAVRPDALEPALVLCAPRRAGAPRPPPAWACPAAACARFVDVPLPDDAPTAVYSVGLLRQPADASAQGAQLAC
jgi:hypothetical protein